MSKLSSYILEEVKDAINLVILKFRFFTSLVLLPEHIADNTIETACTDGKTIRYNLQFLTTLTIQEMVGLVLHELMHIVLGHIWRRGNRNMDKWGVACDYEANHTLQHYGITLPKGGLINPRFKGMLAEAIYDLLPDNPTKQPWGTGDLEQAGKTNPGITNPKHPDAVIWDVMTRKAMSLARKQGYLPAELDRFIQSTKESYPNWMSELVAFFDRICKADYSWSRPNRRYIGEDIYLPSLYSKELPCLAVAIDTSGSIHGELLDSFLANLQTIIEQVRPALTVVISCDAKVQSVREYNAFDPIVFEMKGGGGTDFRPVFKLLDAYPERPSALVYLTDLEGYFPEREPEYPVLWATFSKDLARRVPFGDAVLIHSNIS